MTQRDTAKEEKGGMKSRRTKRKMEEKSSAQIDIQLESCNSQKEGIDRLSSVEYV